MHRNIALERVHPQVETLSSEAGKQAQMVSSVAFQQQGWASDSSITNIGASSRLYDKLFQVQKIGCDLISELHQELVCGFVAQVFYVFL